MINPEVIQRALAMMKRPADYEYFFSQLSRPDWIRPLKEAGMFSYPPEAIREGQYISFPSWPESDYLARMTELAPEIVSDVAAKIPDTENIRVNDDLNRIALLLPPDLAVKFAPKAARWAIGPYAPIFPERLGELIAHLARGGYEDEAIGLARTVLAVLPDPREAERSREDHEFRFPQNPRTLLELWDYEIILNKHIPVLVEAAQESALGMLCALLNDAVRLSHSSGEDAMPNDYSSIWRAAIEHGPKVDDVRNALVSAVRDAVEQIAKADSRKVPELVRILAGQRWLVFHRIALHLLRMFPDDASDLAAEWLTKKSLFDDLEVWHEYYLLARDRFSHLRPDQQEVILNWINAGPPDIESFKERREQWFGERPSDETVQKYAKYWRLKRLALFRDSLPPDWRQKYQEWEAEVGPPDYPEYVNPPPTISWGYESPKSDEDLSSMSLDQLIAFLEEWQPSSESPLGPTYEGLGQKITTLVTAQPERFATEAAHFKGLDPTYVRALVSGLRQAIGQKRPFQWSGVIDLCTWLVNRAFEELETAAGDIERDPDWRWARGETAHLLSDGLKREAAEAQLPFNLRYGVWEVIERLTNDPNPTPEHEARYGGTNMDPLTLSLNTNRGAAMHCAVRYALWCQQHSQPQHHSQSSPPQTFDDAPEVRNVLDNHLKPDVDPSQAIRSVYGVWLPSLIQLDENWVVANLSRIFPVDSKYRHLRDAAWQAYIVFNQPWNNVFDILADEYARAIEVIGEALGERRYDPDQHLAEHLMQFYAGGRLRLEASDTILARFYEKAPDDLREHALSFIGRILVQSEGAIPSEVLERFQLLWTARLNEAQKSSLPSLYAKEIAGFGMWFASARFADAWAMTQLKNALNISGYIHVFDRVVERLAQLAPRMPLQTVECLDLMIEGDKKEWHRYAWHEQIRAILEAAINSDDSVARQSAEALIHRLGARDRAYHYLRDLVPVRTE